ncbi:hypothetical protein [Paraurantiacibacter namhicola]|uniref:Terminase small subunit n=1 Tax=Paraurantiacibacter namhicola TaxID=645517 RepID=A0A1C7D538_9SPHN|nr:hypothetical protein [Paraurantiacibacter namhicola]ANU06587.1 hypothetical protein A6F65_00260 [Paraurantiacibacter namhicola]
MGKNRKEKGAVQLSNWEADFLTALAAGETVAAACRLVVIDPSTAYYRRNHHAHFAAQWEKAIKSAEPAKQRATRRAQWKDQFLEALASTSNVTKSAEAAMIPVATAYKERRTNRDFARQWLEALQEGYAHLELETLERLRHGVPANSNKFDIANALRLLTLHKDTVAKERARHTMKDEDEILLGIERKIDRLRAREREGQKLLADLSQAESPDA